MTIHTSGVTAGQIREAIKQAAIRRRSKKDAGLAAMLGDISNPGFHMQTVSGKGVALDMASEAWRNRLPREEAERMEAFSIVADFGLRPNEEASIDEKLRGYGAYTGRIPERLEKRFTGERKIYKARARFDIELFEKQIRENPNVRFWMQRHNLDINDLLVPVLNPFENDRKRGHRVSPEVLNRAALVGVFNTAYPEEYGGLDFNQQQTDYAVRRAIKDGGGLSGNELSNKSIGAKPLALFGTQAQKDFFFPPMVHGDEGGRYLTTFQLTEEDSGTDAIGGMKTTAKLSPDGRHFIIDGDKIFSTNFYVAGHGHLAVMFIDEDTGAKLPTLIELQLPFRFKDTPDVTRQKIATLWEQGIEAPDNPQELFGIASSTQGYQEYNGAHVPVEYAPGVSSVLGGLDGIGRGDDFIFGGLYRGRNGFITFGAAVSELALNEALNEIIDRVRFKKPLCEMEYVKSQITDMAIKTEMLKAYSELSSAILDNNPGMNLIAETGIGKAMASELAYDVVQTANKLHGGKGLMKGQIIELMLRDAFIPLIVEGVNPALLQHGAAVSSGPAMIASQSFIGKLRILWNQIPSLERGDLDPWAAFGLQLSAKGLSIPTMIKGAIYNMGMRDRQLDLIAIALAEANIFARTASLLKLKDLKLNPDKNKKEIAALEAFLTISSGKKLKSPTYVGQLYIDDAKIRYQQRNREDKDLLRKYS